MKTLADFRNVLSRVEYPGYRIVAHWDVGDDYYLQISCFEGICNVTKKPLVWTGRKWRLSKHMTDGEVVQTAFAAVMAANEHETREKFTYRGASIFDPHYDIEKLVALRMQPDALKERAA